MARRALTSQIVTSLLFGVLFVTHHSEGNTDNSVSIETILKDLQFIEWSEKQANIPLHKEQDEEMQRELCNAYVANVLDPNDITDDGFASALDKDLKQWNTCLQYWYSLMAYVTWNYETNITKANSKKQEEVAVKATHWTKDMSRNARIYNKDTRISQVSQDHQRQIRLLSKGTAPAADADVQTLQTTLDELTEIYASASIGDLKLEPNLSKIMATSREPLVLLAVWEGWRSKTGPKMKDKYAELVKLLNQGATYNGYEDYGEAWRDEQFDNTPDLEALCDRLWEELKPLYVQVHTYVRKRLLQFYGNKWVSKNGGLPAHLLGNMWAQDWGNIYDIVKPFPDIPEPDYDEEMERQGYDVDHMFSLANDFYTSLGLPPMTDAFNKQSMKTRPEGRDVVCHASATDLYSDDDFRIKMCADVNMDYFETIHHEMGHIEYFMAYKQQPMVYRNSANSAFHEAIGDLIALSVESRKHLTVIGLRSPKADSSSDPKSGTGKMTGKGNINTGDLKYLMRKALFKLAFLPFGYLVDKWRWSVFNGTITKDNYNTEWWRLRKEIQGIEAPLPRSDTDFDPGAKFHIPVNSPYMCYFVSFVVQFQFYESLCEVSGHTGDLFNCDFYNSKVAGEKLLSMLTLGKSIPWPDALEKMTGKREISAGSINRYFAPLMEWLKEENEGETIGWETR